MLEETKEMKANEVRSFLSKKWGSMTDKEKEPYVKKNQVLD